MSFHELCPALQTVPGTPQFRRHFKVDGAEGGKLKSEAGEC